jgi:hypothetical protein
MLYELVHVVCSSCGEPGIARARASKHPRDIDVECPECGATTTVACAGLGPIWKDPDEPGPDTPVDDWRADRRRMIGIGSRRAGEADTRWQDGH